MHISLNSLVEYGVFHFKISLILILILKSCMVSSVSKYKISLELAKHISDRLIKLLHQTGCNIENRTRRSKIKSNRVIVCQNYPITYYYKFLHDKNNQSNHNYRFLHVSHPCNYGLIAFLAASQIKVILHSMQLINVIMQIQF